MTTDRKGHFMRNNRGTPPMGRRSEQPITRPPLNAGPVQSVDEAVADVLAQQEAYLAKMRARVHPIQDFTSGGVTVTDSVIGEGDHTDHVQTESAEPFVEELAYSTHAEPPAGTPLTPDELASIKQGDPDVPNPESDSLHYVTHAEPTSIEQVEQVVDAAENAIDEGVEGKPDRYFRHPRGGTIVLHADGSMDVRNKVGEPSTTTVTPKSLTDPSSHSTWAAVASLD